MKHQTTKKLDKTSIIRIHHNTKYQK